MGNAPGHALRLPAGDRVRARPDRRAPTRLDPRLARAPADRRIRMRRCEVLPRLDPLMGAGPQVWTWRAGRAHPQ